PAQPPTQHSAPSTQDSPNVSDLDERRRTKSSPLVRKIAKENNVDISAIEGTGVSGRVTKNDILDYLQKPASAPAAPPSATRMAEEVRIEPLSVMRKKIAQHMVLSKQTSAHVT